MFTNAKQIKLLEFKLKLIIICLIILLTAGCKSKKQSNTPVFQRLEVFVSIPPLAHFVERIGSKYVNVQILLKPGDSPHNFEPSPKQISKITKSVLFFTIGMPFEDRIVEKVKSSAGQLAIVSTDKGVNKRVMSSFHHEGHEEHEDKTNYKNYGNTLIDDNLDPHIWLGPSQIRVLVQNITQAFQETDPAHASEYFDNLNLFLKDLDAIDLEIREILKSYKGQTFYVFHPAFGYFGDAYGLIQEAVEIDGKIPTPKQLVALIHKARTDNIKIIFVQPQFDQKNAETIAKAIDGEVVPMNSMAEDVLQNLRDMTRKIEQALKR